MPGDKDNNFPLLLHLQHQQMTASDQNQAQVHHNASVDQVTIVTYNGSGTSLQAYIT